MGHLKPLFQRDKKSFGHRRSGYFDRPLQIRFVRRIATLIVGASLLAFLPALYYLNDNFNFIRDMMAGVSPDLVGYVEREQVYINLIILGLLLAQSVFILVYVKRMSAQIVAPIKKLTYHFRDLSLGKYQEDRVKIRENDEFQDLVNTYNYFYGCVKKQKAKEMAVYQQALDEGLPPKAHALIEKLLNERKHELEAQRATVIEINDSSSTHETTDDSRHVS